MSETAELLAAIEGYLTRYVILTAEQTIAVALWAMLTYVYDVGDTVPYLVITSAEKRSGKTRLLECLYAVCREPMVTTALTEAVLFRAIQEWQPTLLIDETDTIFKEHKSGPSERQEGLRAILNAGYRKGTTVARCAPNGDILKFNVYGPKALAGIGNLPETIEDRGLLIRLKRKLSEEEVERFRFRTGHAEGELLRTRCTEWGAGARILLAGCEPDMPAALDDRAQDAYEILVAIADLGGQGERARAALVELRSEDSTAKESMGVRLFRDLSEFVDRLKGMERIATPDLLALLYEHGEEPWEEWWHEATGKKASMALARIFREYGVRPEQYKDSGVKKRGYRITEVLAAHSRYMGGEVGTSVPLAPSQGLRDSEVGTEGSSGTDLQSAALQGGTVSTDLFPHVEALDLDWIGQASLDDLRNELPPPS